MTEHDLSVMLGRAVGLAVTHPHWANVTDDTAKLVEEVRRLRAQVASHAERIAAQSELLSAQAEGKTVVFGPGKPYEKTMTLLPAGPALTELAKSICETPPTVSLPMEVLAKAEDVRPHDPDSPVRRGPRRDGFNDLSWSATPPTEPGWYWHRGPHGVDVKRVRPLAGGGCGYDDWRDFHRADTGQWAGPLTPPASAAPDHVVGD